MPFAVIPPTGIWTQAAHTEARTAAPDSYQGDRRRVPDDRRSSEDRGSRVYSLPKLQRRLVDSTRPPHYADFMNLHVPPELEAKLDRLAAATGRRPDQLALDLLASSVDHDDWFREEVEKGRESARAGRLLDHDEVVSRINQRYGG